MQITLEIVDPRGFKYRLTPEEARELHAALGKALGLDHPPVSIPHVQTPSFIPSTSPTITIPAFAPADSGGSLPSSFDPIRWGGGITYGTVTVSSSAEYPPRN
jgi:hypothetical protein